MREHPKTDTQDWYCSTLSHSVLRRNVRVGREANNTRQEVDVNLKSNLLWAIASVALLGSALFVDQGPVKPLMAEYTESAQESAG